MRELRDWAFAHGHDLRAVELDVLSQDSADAAVRTIVAEQGRLDVVVHNAGHLVIGPTEAFTPEEMTRVFDTNVFGAQRVNRAALPMLRAQGSGLLLWVGSSTTRGGYPPFMGPYAAAKAAMDSIAVTMSYELTRFGVETSIVVPGAFTSGTAHFPNAGKPAEKRVDQRCRALPNLIPQILDGLDHELIRAPLEQQRAEPPVLSGKVIRFLDQSGHCADGCRIARCD